MRRKVPDKQKPSSIMDGFSLVECPSAQDGFAA